LAPVTTAVRPARLGMSAVVHVICEWMFIQFATSSNVTLDTPSLRDRGYRRAVPTIETATGPVDSAELGRVLMHEHVFIISPEMKDNVPEEWGEEEAQVANAATRLQEAHRGLADTLATEVRVRLREPAIAIVEPLTASAHAGGELRPEFDSEDVLIALRMVASTTAVADSGRFAEVVLRGLRP